MVIHTIPIPIGWSIEQAWEAISRGELLTHPLGKPAWANIETDVDDRFIRVLPVSLSQQSDGGMGTL